MQNKDKASKIYKEARLLYLSPGEDRKIYANKTENKPKPKHETFSREDQPSPDLLTLCSLIQSQHSQAYLMS